MNDRLSLWTIYDHPRDYPRCFVARRYELDQATADVLTAGTLADLRAKLPPGLTRLERAEGDDAKIVEVWI